MVTSIWCRDRLQCTPATVLFFMQVRLPNPPSPQPKIGCSIMKGSDPEARQVMSTVLKFRSAESPISCPLPYRPRGNNQTEPTSSQRGALIILRVYLARQGVLQTRAPLTPSVR